MRSSGLLLAIAMTAPTTSAQADVHTGSTIGLGKFLLDSLSDGHGPEGTGTAIAVDGVTLADLTGWLRGGGGLGYRFLTGGSTSSWRPGHLLDLDALLQARVGAGANGAVTFTAGVSLAYARYPGSAFDLTAYGTMATARIGYQHRAGPARAWLVELVARTPTSGWSMRFDTDENYWSNAKHAVATLTLGVGMMFDR